MSAKEEENDSKALEDIRQNTQYDNEEDHQINRKVSEDSFNKFAFQLNHTGNNIFNIIIISYLPQ